MIYKLGILEIKKLNKMRRTKTYMYLKKLETNFSFTHRKTDED